MNDIPDAAVTAALEGFHGYPEGEKYRKDMRDALEAALPHLYLNEGAYEESYRECMEEKEDDYARYERLRAAAQHVIDVHDEGWPYALGDVQVNRRAAAIHDLRDVLNEEKS